MFKKLTLLLGSLALMTTAAYAADAPKASDAENTLYLDLKDGRVIVQMMPDTAPRHVERIKTLAREGFYDGLTFHRVIDGFMAQTGDPTGTGRSGSKLENLKAEFSPYTYKRGTIGMARTSDPDSANSQFFICFSDDGCRSLTGQYTVWGQVTEGMQYVDNIAKGEPPASPDKIVKMIVASDMDKATPAAGDKIDAKPAADAKMGESKPMGSDKPASEGMAAEKTPETKDGKAAE